MASKIWRNLIRTAAAACFVAGSSAQAGGVFYQSDFDPDDFIVKNIVWVNSNAGDSSCLSGIDSDTGTFVPTTSLWNPASLRDASECSVTLYSSVATITSGSEVAYIDFVPASTNPGPNSVASNIILGIYVKDHALAGVLWAPVLIGPVRSSDENREPYSGDDELEGRWKMQFWNTDFAGPPFDAYALLFHKHRCSLSNLLLGCYEYEAWARLQTDETQPGEGFGLGYSFVSSDTPPSLRRDGAAIPEPGSLALLGGALVAGWLTRRRKNA